MIILGSTIKTIGQYYVRGCSNVTEVIFPQTLERINTSAFDGCPNLKSVEMPSGIKRIFKNWCKPEIPEYTVPAGLMSDGDGGWMQGEVFTVSGTLDYGAALDMLDLVNQERANEGKDSLVIDKQLTELAMKRAIEISTYFSHTRPNGTDNFTVFDGLDYPGARGENILAGYSSASGAFSGWMGSSGHKANMMRDGYKSVGIGCFEGNGVYYWVQIFAETEYEGQVKRETKQVSEQINIYKGYISTLSLYVRTKNVTGVPYLDVNDTADAIVRLYNQEWESPIANIAVTCDNFKFESTDTSVARVDDKGHIQCVGPGMATIRLTYGDIVDEETIRVLYETKSIIIPEHVDLKVGEEVKIQVKFGPEDQSTFPTELKWSFEDDEKAYSSTHNNKTHTITLKGVKPGKGSFTVTTDNGLSATTTITVTRGLKGDVNNDGRVTLYDALQILKQAILKWTQTENELWTMDYNDDGAVTLYDALKFLQKAILG